MVAVNVRIGRWGSVRITAEGSDSRIVAVNVGDWGEKGVTEVGLNFRLVRAKNVAASGSKVRPEVFGRA